MGADLETGWRELVYGRHPAPWAPAARAGLRVLGALYGAGMRSYRLQYDLGLRKAEQMPCAICSVGNLTVGGTGKTTTVRWVARRLLEWRTRPAILSYGYRAGGRGARIPGIVAGPEGVRLSAQEGGDEPQLLARSLPGVPVLIGRKRVLSARLAHAEFGATVCVMDDGFQYWKMRKDLELLLLDAQLPFGPGGVFPGGTLREPADAVRRADAVLITHASWADRRSREKLMAWIAHRAAHGGAPIRVAEARHVPICLRDLDGGERLPLEALRDGRWLALSSLGQPEAFERTLSELGARTAPGGRFPDHHPYTADDLCRVRAQVDREGLAGVVTTEKDAVKLDPTWLAGARCRVLEIDLEFLSGQLELETLLRERLAQS